MSQYLLKGEYVPSVDEVAGGKGMTAQMGMKPTYAGLTRNPLKHCTHAVPGDRLTVRSEKEAPNGGIERLGAETQQIP